MSYILLPQLFYFPYPRNKLRDVVKQTAVNEDLSSLQTEVRLFHWMDSSFG
jgi:hypothetical protein